MEWVHDEMAWEHLLESTPSVLFVFVNWSTYARRGLTLFESAERTWLEQSREPLSLWACDMSSEETAPHCIADWVRNEHTRGKLRLLPAISVGSGSIMWVHQGRAVAFEMSMCLLGLDGFLTKSQQVLSSLKSE